MVETYSANTANGSYTWQFKSTLPMSDMSAFEAVMARHALGFGQNVTVDVVAAQANYAFPSDCSVYGWNSQTSNVPIWSWTLPDCDAELYDSYRCVMAD